MSAQPDQPPDPLDQPRRVARRQWREQQRPEHPRVQPAPVQDHVKHQPSGAGVAVVEWVEEEQVGPGPDRPRAGRQALVLGVGEQRVELPGQVLHHRVALPAALGPGVGGAQRRRAAMHPFLGLQEVLGSQDMIGRQRAQERLPCAHALGPRPVARDVMAFDEGGVRVGPT